MLNLSFRFFNWSCSSEFIFVIIWIFLLTTRTRGVFTHKSGKNGLLFYCRTPFGWFNNRTPTNYICVAKLLLRNLWFSCSTRLGSLRPLSRRRIIIKGELHSSGALRDKLSLLIRFRLNLSIKVRCLRLLAAHYIGNISKLIESSALYLIIDCIRLL